MTRSARHRRRTIASILVAAATLGAVGMAAVPATAAAGRLADQTVISGNARFQVLSPTLIRSEYAGDGAFTDDATFNAIGRDGFAPAQFSTSVDDGWLTIDTGSMVVKYHEKSGDFTAKNLSIGLTSANGQKVVGAPWTAPEDVSSCAPGVLCEAESAVLAGLTPATNHTGYTGKGFAAGYEAVGNRLTLATSVEAAGDYDLALRYANNQGGDGQVTTRTLTVTVDGAAPKTISLPPTASWDSWALASTALTLTAGDHRIAVERTATDSGSVNLDSLAVIEPGAQYPSPTTTVTPCAFGTLCDAEKGALSEGATAATDHNGAAGGVFLAGLGRGATQTSHVTGVPKDGDYALQLRYANGQPGARTVSVSANGGASSVASLPVTSGWDYWRTVSVPVHLTAGDNDVSIGCPDDASCQVNVDTLAVTGSDAALLAPHAALGGYRRDLDTANGTVPTNPGLLYQDGWSLLDDTASATYDTSTKAVTPRGDHGGAGYHDGYLFGYGSAYTTALGDLARLTGPTALLPKWTYGVWYSEYYDRTAADFTDTIVPAFRSHGVPLDVMAVDTDYKSPDKWNGWEIDTTRFPDMAKFLASLEAQGIHNTLNVHPTISSADPKLPAAQATAGGTLTPSGDKFLFDWSQKAQLQAYFDLHEEIKAAGTEIWWLDWCCGEGSQYSAPGVTPDAFINSQYAKYSDAALGGRGFAFSRAYGSLTAGGYGNPQPVATGPWADKRTTLHFTGDTVSSWPMLQAQVGYTPGESASTGLAAVSHDIGGHTGGTTFPGAEPESTKLADDLYARWVQLGTFQPIDRLHSNHSDRLPWQYGAAADASATKFLNLRENLMPLTYTLAAQASATGQPMVRPLYLQYPRDEEAYAMAGREYLYGSDVLVAPVTTAGETATTTVWFPGGSDWTDYFTGETHPGGSTAEVTTGLDRMPVFVRSGGIVPVRSQNVTGDDQNTMSALTLNVTGGADGSFDLYEDDGGAVGDLTSATTPVKYTQQTDGGTLDIAPVSAAFDGQVAQRAWTTTFSNVVEPKTVRVDGEPLEQKAWSFDPAARTLTVTVPSRAVTRATTVSFSTTARAVPHLAVDKPTVAPGATQTVRGTGFPASTDIVLTTEPDVGGTTVTTDADGLLSATLPIPSNAEGTVTVVARAAGTELARVGFAVQVAAVPGDGDPTPGRPDGSLAFTGATIGALGVVAAALVALGVVLLLRRRRRAAV